MASRGGGGSDTGAGCGTGIISARPTTSITGGSRTGGIGRGGGAGKVQRPHRLVGERAVRSHQKRIGISIIRCQRTAGDTGPAMKRETGWLHTGTELRSV